MKFVKIKSCENLYSYGSRLNLVIRVVFEDVHKWVLLIAQKNNYMLMVYITFSTGVHVPMSQLYYGMAVVLTVGQVPLQWFLFKQLN